MLFVKFLVSFLLCLSFLACSSAPLGEHTLRGIVLDNLHVRRPDRLGATDRASPGEPEYLSDPRPNQALDCESKEALFKDINLKELRACLLSVSQISTQKVKGKPDPKLPEVRYRLHREITPYFELKHPEEAPACLRQLLPKILVPREIVFQSMDEGLLSCFDARIPVAAEEFLGISAALNHFELKVNLAPQDRKVPETDHETLNLLTTWILSPFFEVVDETNQLRSRIVPTESCRKCLGDKNLITDLKDVPPLWQF
jgi:hypothetical protein